MDSTGGDGRIEGVVNNIQFNKTTSQNGYFYRRSKRIVGQRSLPALLTVFLACVILTGVGKFASMQRRNLNNEDAIVTRQLLQVDLEDEESKESNRCISRSIEEFPDDFMTLEVKQKGGVIVHIIIATYLFAAVAIVCDNYFVASLEHICEVTHLKSDVAGATFMAAGSSAPELFTSFIGVFITNSDVGISTIVGSAVFNIICIIALCGLLAGMVIKLTWWPLTRDCGFYTISVFALIIVIQDSVVHWYEALVFILLYVIYIGMMYFNDRIENYLKKFSSSGTDYIEVEPLIARDGEGPDYGMKSDQPFADSNLTKDEIKSDDYVSPIKFPQSFTSRLFWLIMLPANFCFVLTIPDCRRPGIWSKLFPITFLFSVLWIAGITYILVWMVCIIGDTFGIPDTVMGLSLLAAGTSIPDAVSSVLVARDGFGDMAVSNGIGSNVFDILICLGLPWFMQTAIVSPNSTVHIYSDGLWVSSVALLSTVVCIFVAVMVNKWRLTRLLGAIFMLIYIIVVLLMSLYEMNVFGYVNPGPCPRKNQ